MVKYITSLYSESDCPSPAHTISVVKPSRLNGSSQTYPRRPRCFPIFTQSQFVKSQLTFLGWTINQASCQYLPSCQSIGNRSKRFLQEKISSTNLHLWTALHVHLNNVQTTRAAKNIIKSTNSPCHELNGDVDFVVTLPSSCQYPDSTQGYLSSTVKVAKEGRTAVWLFKSKEPALPIPE